ncbi:flavin-dependent oxidoreductase [Scopulibacillus cellulosilyticus]|uniref:Flavin-dependent oxidoreductase n=1 Tax=Scopulibacillus cellulosilyticus TaxID=2665665 RepID=A0ABW2PRM9_9BACL
MPKSDNVMIIGGGIGGLVTALNLHKAGFSVRVFESVENIRELGVGINLLPHAVRVLTHLGLSDELAKEGLPTSELIYCNKFGQKIWQEPRGKAAGYKWPQYAVHRGRLQMLLLRITKQRLGEDAIKTGHHLTSFHADENGVTAHFENRKTGRQIGSYRADCMIGADGIHSAVRRSFYPDEGPPKFSGNIMWRGLSKCPSFLTGRSMVMIGHLKQKFVAYPLRPQQENKGEALINWIAELRINSDVPPKRDWNREANKADFAPSFSNWRFDWLDVPKIINAASAVYEFPMTDRDPLPRWSFGRVTLLGDAAHPMYPIGSNGASQAMLDAEALTKALLNQPDVKTAFRQYEAARLETTASIVESNRKLGPERAMQIVEDRAPNGFTDINEVISRKELEAISNKYKQLAGFDKETLNAR